MFFRFLHKLKLLQGNLTPDNDKLGHFYFGFIYSLVGYLIGVYLVDLQVLVFLLPLFISALGELLDSITGDGNSEFLDIFYTCISGVLIYILFLL